MSEATILLGAVERGDPQSRPIQLLELVLPGFASFGPITRWRRSCRVKTLQADSIGFMKRGLRPRRFRESNLREPCSLFFAAAAEAMRRILIDRARSQTKPFATADQ